MHGSKLIKKGSSQKKVAIFEVAYIISTEYSAGVGLPPHLPNLNGISGTPCIGCDIASQTNRITVGGGFLCKSLLSPL